MEGASGGAIKKAGESEGGEKVFSWEIDGGEVTQGTQRTLWKAKKYLIYAYLNI